MVFPSTKFPSLQCSWAKCYAWRGLKGNQNQPVERNEKRTKCCDPLSTKLPNNPLNKLHNSFFSVCHVLPWALRALRGNSLCGGVGGAELCSRRVSLHKRRWLLIWAADLKPLFGCRRINGQSRKPLKLHIGHFAVHELDSHV